MLDDRDDKVFASISISPVSLNVYIGFKVGFASLMAVLAGLATILISGAFHITPLQMFLVALLAAMQVPVNALLVSGLASNRAEGLGATKVTGILVICPVVAWFLLDWKAWLFAPVPGFWPAKAMQSLLLESAVNAGQSGTSLGFYGYIGLGFLWCTIAMILMYAIFKKKIA